MEKPAFRDANRAQMSLLAPFERRCLIWLAHRMPAWVNSDHLTGLGLASMLMAGLCYWLARWNRLALLLVVFWLAANWFGDSLDGTLARVRNRLRPRYGFYVDHVVDAFGSLFLLGGLALSGYMHPMIAMALLVAFLMLSIESYLAAYTIGTFRLSHWKFSPTELRILLAVGNMALIFRPIVRLWGDSYRLFDVGGVVGLAGMGLMLIAAVWRNTKNLYQQERLS
ncbi:MAG: CDP-alcohol phosphatidyltransferase family protein [Acidobacteria bacterium]|nr:CDP-alcohol phosphatidyltransferase family protein [Acidobacteriota bacterium]